MYESGLNIPSSRKVSTDIDHISSDKNSSSLSKAFCKAEQKSSIIKALIPQHLSLDEVISVLEVINQGQLPKSTNNQTYLFRAEYTRRGLEKKLNSLKDFPDGIGEVRVVENGSMACGHFTGPKPVIHSANYENIKLLYPEITKIAEVDLRVIIREDLNPTDSRILDIVAEQLKPYAISSRILSNTKRWDLEIDMASLFLYEQVSQDTLVEYEVCVNREPYLEVSEFWKKIFTEDEIAWQVSTRELLRALCVDYKDIFCPLKRQQCQEARWRITSYYALKYLGHELPESDFFQKFADTEYGPKQIKWLVQHWIDGESGISSETSVLDKPSTQFVNGSEQMIKEIAILAGELFSIELSEKIMSFFDKPDAPHWVERAFRIQNGLQKLKNPKA